MGGTAELNVFIDGNPNTYPFDRYQYGQPPVDAVDPIEAQLSDPAPLVSVVELGPDNQPLAAQIPIGVYPSGGLQGGKRTGNTRCQSSRLGKPRLATPSCCSWWSNVAGEYWHSFWLVLGLMVVTAVLSALLLDRWRENVGPLRRRWQGGSRHCCLRWCRCAPTCQGPTNWCLARCGDLLLG